MSQQQPDNTVLPSLTQLRAFLRQVCRPDRVERRDGALWGRHYSLSVVQDHQRSLRRSGQSYLSRHETLSGEGLFFTAKDIVGPPRKAKERLKALRQQRQQALEALRAERWDDPALAGLPRLPTDRLSGLAVIDAYYTDQRQGVSG